MDKGYEIKDLGKERVLVTGNKEYRTYYSKKIIELLIQRKGLGRAPQYFTHKSERSKFLNPLFDYLNQNSKGLRILEVGCSAGHITEYLNEQTCVEEIYTFDIDRVFVEITREKKAELGLQKVRSIDHFSGDEILKLPYKDNFFDIIIVLAVVEHLPFENRYVYVDSYYRKLKLGGIIGFWDTPNRYFPFERHSIGLPFIQRFSPQCAYIYAKLFGKLKGISFPEFVRMGTGWRNATYYELLPKTLMIDVKDISEETGYFCENKIINLISKACGAPTTFFTPNLNVIFRKVKEYE